MFSTKLTRAAHRAAINTSTSTPAACLCTAAGRRPTHQRRHSSSKASWPPDNSASKPAPAAKSGAAETEQSETQAPASERKSTKGRTRGGYRRVGQQTGNGSKAVASEPIDQFAGLPSVPTLQGLDAKDLTLSSFFSLHRPISLTSPLPPPTTPETFHSLFTTSQARQHAENPWGNGNSAERRPEDVIYTLHNTIENLENGARSSEDEGVRWEVIHESPSNNNNSGSDGGVKHLDGRPQQIKSLDELVAQFRPFRTPPPPQPFVTASEKGTQDKQSATRGRPRQKTFTTTITVTESTHADGQKTYSASSSPIVRLPDATQTLPPTEPQQRQQRQPFLTRMYARQSSKVIMPSQDRALPVRREVGEGRQWRRRKFFLISVKRQRKLKMKKHKYKKLMKRTRNLRRRLERN